MAHTQKLVFGGIGLLAGIIIFLSLGAFRHVNQTWTAHKLEIDSSCNMWFDGSSGGYATINEGDTITYKARDTSVHSFAFHFNSGLLGSGASPFPNPNPPPPWQQDFNSPDGNDITTQHAIIADVHTVFTKFSYSSIYVNGQPCLSTKVQGTGVHVQK